MWWAWACGWDAGGPHFVFPTGEGGLLGAWILVFCSSGCPGLRRPLSELRRRAPPRRGAIHRVDTRCALRYISPAVFTPTPYGLMLLGLVDLIATHRFPYSARSAPRLSCQYETNGNQITGLQNVTTTPVIEQEASNVTPSPVLRHRSIECLNLDLQFRCTALAT